MSASSPLPESVRRDIERMAGPLAERMLPPKVTQSSTTRNVVAAVNDDGTVDVMMGGAVMQRVPATTACVGVAVGDEVIVEQYGPRLYCVGVVAKSLDNAPYVELYSETGGGYCAYRRQGALVCVVCDYLSTTARTPKTLGILPADLCPAKSVIGMGYVRGVSSYGQLTVDVAGNVAVWSSVSSDGYFGGAVTYPLPS